ncbi:MAG: Crp/Fnr family transcriptional regulator [Alphaproteobacteria bacterium]|nr:Crp/Fnr family transcriptional regulator [Alphaproteobacteria bacterium]
MAFTEKHDGQDIIYHEGDKSYSAYILKKGVIELFKGAASGRSFARLNAGDVFGEMGMVDGGVRSETSVAATEVMLEVLTQKELVERLKQQPDLTVNLMKRMGERMRASDDTAQRSASDVPFEVLHEEGQKALPSSFNAPVLVSSSNKSISKPAIKTMKKRGLGEVLRTLFVRRQILNKIKSNTPTVIICKLNNDEGDKYRKSLQACFEEIQGMIVRFPENDNAIGESVFDGSASADLANNVESFEVTAEKQAKKLFQREKGDVVIWGGKRGEFLELYITVEGSPAAGLDTYLKPLTLPESLNADTYAFVKAVALGKITNPRANAMKNSLPMYLEMAKRIVVHVPAKITNKNEVDNIVCYADVAFGIGLLNPSWFSVAAEFYMTALKLITKKDEIEYTYINYQVALILNSKAGRTRQHKLLKQAIEYCGYALETADYRHFPHSYATIKIMLGKLSFKLSLMNADEKELKEAISSYQSGLKYFNRLEHPMQWAEVIDLLAQALRHYGEQINSSSAIDQSISLCTAALEIRTKKKYPLLWASTKNNLGLTQFMMGVHSGNSEFYKDASNSFHEALSIYNTHNDKKHAAATEKNLIKAETMYSSQPSKSDFILTGKDGVSVSLSAAALASATTAASKTTPTPKTKAPSSPKTSVGVKGLRAAKAQSVPQSIEPQNTINEAKPELYDGERNVFGEPLPPLSERKHPTYLDKIEAHHGKDHMGVMIGDLPWTEDDYAKKPNAADEMYKPVQDVDMLVSSPLSASDRYVESTINAEKNRQVNRGFGKSSAYTLADSLSETVTYSSFADEKLSVAVEKRFVNKPNTPRPQLQPRQTAEQQKNHLENLVKKQSSAKSEDVLTKNNVNPRGIPADVLNDIIKGGDFGSETLHPQSFEDDK